MAALPVVAIFIILIREGLDAPFQCIPQCVFAIGRSLMQRLSSWFEDHLPLRRRDNVRRSERGSRRKASKSAAPRMRYTVTNAAAAKQNSDFVDQMMPIAGSGPHSMSISMIDKESFYDDGYVDQRSYYHDDMSASAFGHLETSIPALESMSQSFSSTASRPSRIRTNPWVTGTRSQFRSPQPPATRSHYSAPDALSSAASGKGTLTSSSVKKPNPELLYSSMDRSAQLRVKSLDESTCSSGYGSQDSSPESSVHSPDWQQKRNVEDKAVECHSVDLDATVMGMNESSSSDVAKMRTPRADFYDDEHMYHEVETLHRLSLLLEEHACTSEAELMSPQPTMDRPDALDGVSRCSSPIYAVPYDSHRNSLSEANPFDCRQMAPAHGEENPYARIAPLSIESPFFREGQNLPRTNIRHRPPPPTWNPPPPPPLDTEDCMAELDKQIAELQIQSDAVRMLVEEAKRHSELREKTRLICMEHINELRKMRWYMRNNFELCL
uniref:RING-type domain-containing protein n=1 Tax=Panagrellus redivivus TaxID=6233 RepID=A0A7E4VVY9_PANRE